MADPVMLGDFTQQAAPPGSRPSPGGAAQPGTWYIEEAAGGGKLHRRVAPGGRRRVCDISPRSRSAGPAASFATPSLISATKPRFNSLASDVVHRARKQVKDEASHLSTAGKEPRWRRCQRSPSVAKTRRRTKRSTGSPASHPHERQATAAADNPT